LIQKTKKKLIKQVTNSQNVSTIILTNIESNKSDENKLITQVKSLSKIKKLKKKEEKQRVKNKIVTKIETLIKTMNEQDSSKLQEILKNNAVYFTPSIRKMLTSNCCKSVFYDAFEANVYQNFLFIFCFVQF